MTPRVLQLKGKLPQNITVAYYVPPLRQLGSAKSNLQVSLGFRCVYTTYKLSLPTYVYIYNTYFACSLFNRVYSHCVAKKGSPAWKPTAAHTPGRCWDRWLRRMLCLKVFLIGCYMVLRGCIDHKASLLASRGVVQARLCANVGIVMQGSDVLRLLCLNEAEAPSCEASVVL